MRIYPVISEAVDDHLHDMQQRGAMPATIANHKQAMNHAIRLWGDIDVRNIREDNIEAFITTPGWSPGTQMIYLGAIRKFCEYLRRNDYWPRTYDPTDGIQIRYVPVRDRLYLTVEEMVESIDIAENERDKIALSLAVYLFPRASEIRTLKIGDVDLERNFMRLYRHKNKTWDRMPISTELHDRLENWLDHYEKVEGDLDQEWLLVPSMKPHNMTGVAGSRTFVPTGEPRRMRVHSHISNPHTIAKRVLEKLGYRGVGNGFHVYRRSGARALFERLRAEGYDHSLRRVAAMLGHKETSITEHYIGVDAERRARDEMISGKRMFNAA